MNQMTMPSAFDPGEHPELFARPAIFLSASVPKRRPLEQLTLGATRQDDERWSSSADPVLIRDAVAHLCRFAFGRDLNLIFGGHPAITPMVLEAARRFGGGERPRVVVFQSLHFWTKIPKATFELADWSLGTALWTKDCEAEAQTKHEARELSLTHMREVMIGSANLIAAVFVGGMEGLLQEEELWRRSGGLNNRPAFAIGSTGGAAADLIATDRCVGERADSELLATSRSYPLVMSRIMEDLDLA